jgi:hypothetical protein
MLRPIPHVVVDVLVRDVFDVLCGVCLLAGSCWSVEFELMPNVVLCRVALSLPLVSYYDLVT